MKYGWIYCIILILACSSQAADNSANADAETPAPANMELESPHLEFKVEGITSGAVLLIGMYQENQYVADSTGVNSDGWIVFQRDQPYRPGLYLVYLPDQRNFQVLIAEDQTGTMTTHTADLVGQMQVEGNIDNELLYEDFRQQAVEGPAINAASQRMRGFSPTDPQYAEAKAERDRLVDARTARLQNTFEAHPNTFFTKYKMAGQNPPIRNITNPDGTPNETAQVYMYRTEFWDNVDFTTNALLYTPVITNKLKRYIQELTYQNPDSLIVSTDHLVQRVLDYPEYYQYFVNWIALQYEPGNTTLMDGEAVYVHIVQNYITYERAHWTDSAQVYALQLRATEMAGSLLGQKAFDVVANDLNGRSQSLYDMDNPYVVVYLFNPTCDHCQEETPKLVNLQESGR